MALTPLVLCQVLLVLLYITEVQRQLPQALLQQAPLARQVLHQVWRMHQGSVRQVHHQRRQQQSRQLQM
jgi:hypothetical protein